MSEKIYCTCSGCFNSEDGYPCGDYPTHPKHGCYIGSGCRECQGRGFVRDHIAESIARDNKVDYIDDRDKSEAEAR